MIDTSRLKLGWQRVLILAYAFSFGCAGSPVIQPVPVPLLSPALDAAKLVPQPSEDEKPKIAPGAQDYPDQPVGKNACGFPTGILLSETAYATVIAEQAELRRRRTEWRAMSEVRRVERKACEEVYQLQSQRILQLERKLAEPPSWWEQHEFKIGVLVGVGLTVGAGYAVGQAAR